jgi:hypothetical protein
LYTFGPFSPITLIREPNRKAHTLEQQENLELINAILKTACNHGQHLTAEDLELIKAHSAKILEDTPPHGADFLAAGQN